MELQIYKLPGINKREKWLLELCAEKELVAENRWFKKVTNKYTWEKGTRRAC